MTNPFCRKEKLLCHKSSVHQEVSDNSDMDQLFFEDFDATESDHAKVVDKYDPWDSLMQKTF